MNATRYRLAAFVRERVVPRLVAAALGALIGAVLFAIVAPWWVGVGTMLSWW